MLDATRFRANGDSIRRKPGMGQAVQSRGGKAAGVATSGGNR